MEKIKSLDKRVQISTVLFLLTELMTVFPFISRFMHGVIFRIEALQDLIEDIPFFGDLIFSYKLNIIETIPTYLSWRYSDVYGFVAFLNSIGMIIAYIFAILVVAAPIVGIVANIFEIKLAPIIACGVQLVVVLISGIFHIMLVLKFTSDNFIVAVLGGALDNYICFILIIVNAAIIGMLMSGKELPIPGKKMKVEIEADVETE